MKSGQARIVTDASFNEVIEIVGRNRYPEKNKAILYISFKLGLRVQEIALLQIKEVAALNPNNTGLDGFSLNEFLALPASYTKGANACRKGAESKSKSRVLSFKSSEFDALVATIIERVQHGLPVNPEDHYPPAKKKNGTARTLPMVDSDLREVLTAYLVWRLDKYPKTKLSDPLFISQKGVPYSPHTLQAHMGKMLKAWCGIERASSHSGRRTLLTKVIKGVGDIKVAQKIAGHADAATTLIYTDATELDVSHAMKTIATDKDIFGMNQY